VSPSTKKAQRAKARAREEKYRQRRAKKLHRRLLWKRIAIGGLIFAMLAGMGYIGVRALLGSPSSPSAKATPTATPHVAVPVVKGCSQVTLTPDTSPQQFTKPATTLTGGKPAALALQTNCGTIAMALATKAAPANSNSLAFLAEKSWYNGSSCHRLTTSGLYVLQCGDPTETGSGTPGYTVKDENIPKNGVYQRGVVAMAKPAGGLASSQFFIVYKQTTLPANYSVVGRVTHGLGIVDRVAKAGVAGGGTDGAPRQAVKIEQATVRQG